ncbi:hypothetical protein R1flu_024839 [Riccia fluitans]|uniref:Early light-induced protein n=1 Tax=Riccia fluitans TaxID=41844 RepID=A0ABD1XW17_9MARC
MAASMLVSATAVPAGLRGAPLASCPCKSGVSSLGCRTLGAPRYSRRGGSIRCEGVRETVDRTTKKEISKEEILQNQETNQSEKQSHLRFRWSCTETINGRLAMVGIVWAAIAEKTSGLTVFHQLHTQGTGLVYYIALVPLIAYASIVPMLNGESTDARSFGPFTARAERWNGRLAMIGFLSLLLTESFIHAPVFTNFF